MKRSAFTLVELLTVIGILAITAAIALPVIAKARGRAHQTACLSNLRQLHGALSLYVQDHESSYPLILSGARDAQGNCNDCKIWLELVAPYLKTPLECPSMSSVGVFSTMRETDRLLYGTGYGYNNFLNGFGQVRSGKQDAEVGTTDWPLVAVYEVPAATIGGSCPDQTPRDALWFARYTVGLDDPAYLRDRQTQPNASDRHNKRSLYLFTNGSVRALRAEQVDCKRVPARPLPPGSPSFLVPDF